MAKEKIQETKVKEAKSRDATIGFRLSGTGAPRLVAAPCGEVSFLSRVSFPFASFEFRGFGASRFAPGAEKKADLDDYIEDVDTVIKESRAERPVLLGYSHGGYFATAYALANANRLTGLVLMEPALFTSRQELIRRIRLAEAGDGVGALRSMIRYVDPKVGANPQSGKQVATQIFRNLQNSESLVAEFRVRAENPIDGDDLAHLRLPVLLIGGTESHVKSMVQRAAASLPEACVWWVRGADHSTLQSEKFAGQISGVVDQFVAQLG